MNPEQIWVVGCGPGAADHLTERARRAAARADHLVGAPRLLELFPELPAERHPVGGAVEEALERIAGCHGTVAVLVTGDPGLFSLGRRVRERFGLRCEVIPGVSSVQVAFARLGLPWEGARILSAHGGVPDWEPEALAREDAVAVLGGGSAGRPWIRELVRVLAPTHRGYALQDLTLPTERVTTVEPEVGELPGGRVVFVFVRRETGSGAEVTERGHEGSRRSDERKRDAPSGESGGIPSGRPRTVGAS